MDIKVEELASESHQSASAAARPTSPLGSLELVEYFGIGYPSSEEKRQLDELWSYARKLSPEGSTEDYISEVLRIKGAVGAPRIDEKLLDRVYRYVKLRKQESLIQQEIADVQGSAYL